MSDFVMMRFKLGNYSSLNDEKYKKVDRDDAENAFQAHLKGNGGRCLLHCSDGRRVSVEVGNFKIVEIGP